MPRRSEASPMAASGKRRSGAAFLLLVRPLAKRTFGHSGTPRNIIDLRAGLIVREVNDFA
jgi:hypothetical protein